MLIEQKLPSSRPSGPFHREPMARVTDVPAMACLTLDLLTSE